MAKVLSVRVDDDLAEWVEGYASRRGAKRAQVHEAALRAFRDLCASGVPDLPEARQGGRPRGEAKPATVTPIMSRRDELLALAKERAEAGSS